MELFELTANFRIQQSFGYNASGPFSVELRLACISNDNDKGIGIERRLGSLFRQRVRLPGPTRLPKQPLFSTAAGVNKGALT